MRHIKVIVPKFYEYPLIISKCFFLIYILIRNGLLTEIEKLKLIAKETVDINGIGFYTLGSKRKTLSNEEKKIYSNLFEGYFLKSFSSRLAEYTNPEIDVISKEKLNDNFT